MIVHRLRYPVDRPDVQLTAVTLRRPVEADRQSFIAAVELACVTSNLKRTPYLIAQLSDLPLVAVRSLSRPDARDLAEAALGLFRSEGLI